MTTLGDNLVSESFELEGMFNKHDIVCNELETWRSYH